MRALLLGALCALLAVAALPTTAAVISDPANDFLPTYTGPKNGDLDVLSAQVFYDGANFTFTSTQNAPIGTTTGGIFVWGINRGAGTPGFPVIAPGVLFDSVFVINPAGGSTVRDLVSGAATPISNISISGASISGVVPLSALPTRGFAAINYTVNLWPRSPGSGDPIISDFAPNNSNAAVTVLTPEPGTMGLFSLVSLGGLALLRRRRSL